MQAEVHSFVNLSNSSNRCRRGETCGTVPDWGYFLSRNRISVMMS